MSKPPKKPEQSDIKEAAISERFFKNQNRNIHDDTIFEIGKFSILWAYFELWYFAAEWKRDKLTRFVDCYFAEKKSDPQLKLLCNSVRDISKSYLEEIDAHLIKERVYSSANSGNENDQNAVLAFFNDEFSQETFLGCMLYIHRVRNNLFHGLKGLNSLNQQKAIFDSINNLLLFICVEEKILEIPNED